MTSPTSLLRQIRTDLYDVDTSNHALQTVLNRVQQLTECENVIIERQRIEIERLKEELAERRKHPGENSKEMECQDNTRGEREEYDVLSEGSFSTATEEDAFERQLVSQSLMKEKQERNSLQQVVVPLANQENVEMLRSNHQEQPILCQVTQKHPPSRQFQLPSLEQNTSSLEQFLQSQLNTLTAERNEAMQHLERETLARKEMERQMSLLYQEKMELEMKLEHAATICDRSEQVQVDITTNLQEQIRQMKVENDSLRHSMECEAATVAELEEEIQSIRDSHSRTNNNNNMDSNRQRLGSTGTQSADGSHECDTVSVLFGRDSIVSKASASSVASEGDESDHKSIRLHAEKLLYWANKAVERKSSSSSQNRSPLVENGSSSSYYAKSPAKQAVPTTIGLPPRSASKTTKMNNGRSLPPRPPSDNGSIGNKSDKENGGSHFNVVQPRQLANDTSKNHKAVIFNLDQVKVAESQCNCSTSPFSGNDAHSEFYLPKLGMACQCGSPSIIDDRDSFSQNPTALHNILRRWQCDFLASLGISTADQLLKSHRAGANDMARKMKRWREEHQLPLARSKECYVALMVWSRTAKVVLRSIEKQKEAGEEKIEKPGFLDIAYEDSYTVGSVSTLGLMSSVGGRVNEMMEI